MGLFTDKKKKKRERKRLITDCQTIDLDILDHSAEGISHFIAKNYKGHVQDTRSHCSRFSGIRLSV